MNARVFGRLSGRRPLLFSSFLNKTFFHSHLRLANRVSLMESVFNKIEKWPGNSREWLLLVTAGLAAPKPTQPPVKECNLYRPPARYL